MGRTAHSSHSRSTCPLLRGQHHSPDLVGLRELLHEGELPSFADREGCGRIADKDLIGLDIHERGLTRLPLELAAPDQRTIGVCGIATLRAVA